MDSQRSPSAQERALRPQQPGQTLCTPQAFSETPSAPATDLPPDDAHNRWRSALDEWSTGHDDLAGLHLQDLVRTYPQFAFGHSSLAEWYLIHGMVDAALDASATSVNLDPENLGVLGARANTLASAGLLDEALVIVQRLVQTGRLTAPIVVLYANLASRHRKTPEALALLQNMLATAGLAPDHEASLRFSAAALLEKLGRYDDAFAQAQLANQLVAHPFDPAAHERRIDAQIAFFSKPRLATLPKSTYRSDKPVLVVGMPRSGTSLVEQVLSSHPAVYGAGELDFLYWTYTGLLNMLRTHEHEYPHCLTRMSADHATGMAQIYLEPLAALSPSASRIIDKMPLNFLLLGLANLILPDARIIHCRRHPVDTCLSCFMTGFAAGNEFTRDLTHLGRFYRQYERLMDHWKQTLDLQILDVNYEDMIADAEGQSRRLVEFLGLPWDDRCLKFYETKRSVTTASSFQVRQPIYNSSLQRWRHYEKHLQPLLTALGRPSDSGQV